MLRLHSVEQAFYAMSALTAKGKRRKQKAGDNSFRKKHISFNSFITDAQKTFFSFPLYSHKLKLKKTHTQHLALLVYTERKQSILT